MVDEVISLRKRHQLNNSCSPLKPADQLHTLAAFLCPPAAIDQRTEIVFDSFNKLDFENKIISEISTNQNVISIIPLDSQNCAGLQFVDNLCSIIRLKKSNKDAYFFYKQIENSVIEI